MYKLSDFEATTGDHVAASCIHFGELFQAKWGDMHNNSNVFRYRMIKLEEKLVDDYLLQLNPDRNTKRRMPEQIEDICQPFDPKKFNFTKVSSDEILLSIEGSGSDVHSILVNVSPISRYHSLLCPSIHKGLPQVVTAESLRLAAELMFVAQDRNLRIAFNSLCGLASVNHLHFHLLINKNVLAIEKVKWVQLKDPLWFTKDYPIPAFCFQIQKHSLTQNISDIYKLLEHFLKKSIAHNVLITRRMEDGRQGSVGVFIWPRKSTKGAKLLSAFNIAALELGGWFIVYDVDNYENLKSENLEAELQRWKLDNFDQLCDEVKNLY